MNAERWPGGGRSHSVVAIQRVAGGTENRLLSSGSYVATLDRASLDTVVAVTTQEPIVTVIAHVPPIVSFSVSLIHTLLIWTLEGCNRRVGCRCHFLKGESGYTCDDGECPCVDSGQECDPELCISCDARSVF